MNTLFKHRTVLLVIALQAIGIAAIGQESTATSNDGGSSSEKASEPVKAASNDKLSRLTGWWFGDCRLFQTSLDRPVVVRLEIRSQADKPTDFTAEISAAYRGFPTVFHKQSLSWDATANRFSGELPLPKQIFGKDTSGILVVHVSTTDNAGELNCQLVPDQAAKKAIEETVRSGRIPNQLEQSYEAWLSFPFSRISSAQKLDAKDFIVVETSDGLAALSKKVGTWSHVSIPFLNNGKTRLDVVRHHEEFASAETDDVLFGYCSRIGKWGRLTIPQEFRGKVKSEFGLGSLTTTMGNKIYSFSPVTGQWTSPDGPAKETAAARPRGLGRLGGVRSMDDDRGSDRPSASPTSEPPSNKGGEGIFFPTGGADENVGFFPGATGEPAAGKPTSIGRMGRGGLNRDSNPEQQSIPAPVETPVVANPGATASSKPITVSGNGVTLIETSDGLAAYSDKLGKWDRITVRPRSDGRTRLTGAVVGTRAGAVVVNNELFGYQADYGRWVRFQFPEEAVGKIVGPRVGMGVVGVRIGRDVLAINGQSRQWSRLTIPEELGDQFSPTVGINFVELSVGDKFYKLSSTTGEWTSPDDGKSSSATEDDAKRFAAQLEASFPTLRRRHSAGSSATIDLTQRISRLESQAAQHANHVREMSQQQAPDSPQMVEAKIELKRELGEALDLRFQREQARIQELRAELGRLEQQIEQRKAQRAAIIDRRTTELLEGESLRWETSEYAPDDGSRNPNQDAESTKADSTIDRSKSGPSATELLLRQKGAHPTTSAQTATEVLQELFASRGTPASTIDSPVLYDFRKLQQIIGTLSGIRRQIALTNEKVEQWTEKLEAAKKSDVDGSAIKLEEEAKGHLESLTKDLKQFAASESLFQAQLNAGRRDFELQISAAKLDMEHFEKLNSMDGILSERMIREAKLKSDQAKLTIERLLNQVELLNEIEKQAGGQ